MKDIDKYRGCLIGGAAGDALGYVDEVWESKYSYKTHPELRKQSR